MQCTLGGGERGGGRGSERESGHSVITSVIQKQTEGGGAKRIPGGFYRKHSGTKAENIGITCLNRCETEFKKKKEENSSTASDFLLFQIVT